MKHGQGDCMYTDICGNRQKYEGEWKCNMMHGYGKCYSFDDSDLVYEGQWENGKEHGRWKRTYADGDVYYGQWKNGKEHGQGKCTSSALRYVYEGEWYEGEKHGKGILKNSTGKVINEGEWINDQFQKQ